MIDREKVTEELQLLRDFLMSEERKAFKGNNNSAVNVLMHYRNIVIDALALLKEQEAVEPIPPTDESDLWKCGNCNHQLFRCTHQRYCEMCGREVKWE